MRSSALDEVPMRGTGKPMPPTDPLIYRFYELVMVNGPACKAADRGGVRRRNHVGDRFRYDDGAALDPKGDRVKITVSGKFLPLKYYRATGNGLAYGLNAEVAEVPPISART